jgi:hypothetical protein
MRFPTRNKPNLDATHNFTKVELLPACLGSQTILEGQEVSISEKQDSTKEIDKIGKGHKKERNDKGSCSTMDDSATQCCHLATLNCKLTI